MHRNPTSLYAAGLLALAVGGGAWWWLGSSAASPEAPIEVLPVPPFPPRIAQGETYERCLALLANAPSEAVALAATWQAQGGGDGALHCRGLALIAAGDPGQGAALLEALARNGSADGMMRATVLSQAVQARLMARQAERAYDDASEALSLTPDDTDLLVGRASAADALGRLSAVVDDLSRALALDPSRTDALVLRAAAYRMQNRLDLAAADLARAIALDPADPEALLQRGILRQRLGDTAGARADWQHARALDPDGPAADLAEQNLALLDAGPDRR